MDIKHNRGNRPQIRSRIKCPTAHRQDCAVPFVHEPPTHVTAPWGPVEQRWNLSSIFPPGHYLTGRSLTDSIYRLQHWQHLTRAYTQSNKLSPQCLAQEPLCMSLVSATGHAHETSHTSSRHTAVWCDAISQLPELLRVDCKWSLQETCVGAC